MQHLEHIEQLQHLEHSSVVDLSAIKKEYDSLISQLASPALMSDWPASNAERSSAGRPASNASHSDAGWEKFDALNKRRVLLEKILERGEQLKEIETRIKENKLIAASPEEPEIAALAEAELVQLLENQKTLEEEIAYLVEYGEEKQNVKSEKVSVIMEIRAGAGGDEAGLFAADLFRMYSRYAESQGWQLTALEDRKNDLGGFKEIIFELRNGDVYSKMKYEAGVHRVQRIPETEKAGRIHTSTATVAVLPKPEKRQFQIKPDDLKIEFYKSSGPGGQNVNKRETAVRIIHLPTGLTVTSQTERNQLKNKENAMKILEARLWEQIESREAEKTQGKRTSQIGRAKRVEKIRTYNFPQDRLTDHRVKKSWRNLDKIMDGGLEPVIEALRQSETNLL